MKKAAITFALLLISSYPCYAAWDIEMSHGETTDDRGHSIRQTQDGGYIMAAWIDWDFGMVKLNPDGTTAWKKVYTGSGDDRGYYAEQISDGDYIAAGATNSFGAGDYDVWMMRLHSDGTVAWQKIYGGPDNDWAYSVQETSDKGYIVVGGLGNNAWVSKLESDGSISWQKKFTLGVYGASAFSIQQTEDDGFIVAGYRDTPAGDGLLLIKLDRDGSVDWSKIYPGLGGYHMPASVRQTTDGGYIVAGLTEYVSDTDHDIWVAKLNSNGTVIWQKTYGETGPDIAMSAQQTQDGGYIVAGTIHSLTGPYSRIWVLKLNTDGTIAWQRTHEGILNIFSTYSIQQTMDLGYIITGVIEKSDLLDHNDILVLKLNENGEIPGCSAMGTSEATVLDASIAAEDVELISADTFVVPYDTFVSPEDISLVSSVICEAPEVKSVVIDIKPGSDDNCLNQDEDGVIPVAIYGNADIDVNDIDIGSLSLQGLTIKVAGKSDKYMSHIENINNDEYDDLVLQFEDSDGWVNSGGSEAKLSGMLYDGTPIEGVDAIRIVP